MQNSLLVDGPELGVRSLLDVVPGLHDAPRRTGQRDMVIVDADDRERRAEYLVSREFG